MIELNELKAGDVVSFRMDNGNTFIDWRCAVMVNQDCVDLFTNGTINAGHEWQLGIHPSLIPEGYAIVPIEPSDDMLHAAFKADLAYENKTTPIGLLYKSMINAAPKHH